MSPGILEVLYWFLLRFVMSQGVLEGLYCALMRL